MEEKKLTEITEKISTGRIGEVDTKDLEVFLQNCGCFGSDVANETRFEIQKRQNYASIIAMEKSAVATEKSVKWQKWVALATAALAIATFVLAYLTWVK